MTKHEKPVTIILVAPENPDNIGAVARAMKNMGLSELRLVRPPVNWKQAGKKMAVTAGSDVLEDAQVFDSVSAAVQDMQMIVGTTRRLGPKRGAFISYDEAVKKIKKARRSMRAAIMFGRESKGMDNHSLGLCDWVINIPANPEYPSINLAQAVMLVAFSLFDHSTTLPMPRPKRGHGRYQKQQEQGIVRVNENIFISKEEMFSVLENLYIALKALDYDEKGSKASRIQSTFHRLFKRAGLLHSEAQMFKGLSRRICEKMESESVASS